MTNNMLDIVVHHFPCSDGIASAWVSKLANPSVELVKCNAGDIPIFIGDVSNKVIGFVDLCPPAEYISLLCKVAKSVVILDHHEPNYSEFNKYFEKKNIPLDKKLGLTYEEENEQFVFSFIYEKNMFNYLNHSMTNRKTFYKELTNKKFDEEHLSEVPIPKNLFTEFDKSRSGCMIAWDYFNKYDLKSSSMSVEYNGKQYPWFIGYIGDRDLWLYALTNSKNINNALFEDGWIDVNKLSELNNNENSGILDSFNDRGAEISAFKEKLITNTIKYHSIPCKYKAHTGENQKEYNVWLYTGRIDIMSDVGNKLMDVKIADDIYPDFSVYWRYDATTQQYWLSMRSIDSRTDVSEICKSYGGGGHRNAAGCSFSGKTTILEDIFTPIK